MCRNRAEASNVQDSQKIHMKSKEDEAPAALETGLHFF